MIIGIAEIEIQVSKVSGTWVKRKNLRNRLVSGNNKEVNRLIELIRSDIRKKKSQGFKQWDLVDLFGEITELEFKLI